MEHTVILNTFEHGTFVAGSYEVSAMYGTLLLEGDWVSIETIRDYLTELVGYEKGHYDDLSLFECAFVLATLAQNPVRVLEGLK